MYFSTSRGGKRGANEGRDEGKGKGGFTLLTTCSSSLLACAAQSFALWTVEGGEGRGRRGRRRMRR